MVEMLFIYVISKVIDVFHDALTLNIMSGLFLLKYIDEVKETDTSAAWA